MKFINTLLKVALVVVAILALNGNVHAQGTTKAKPVTAQAGKSKDSEIDAKVLSLSNLISRIQGMKNVSDADKSALVATIQNLMANLGSLKGQTATTSTDVENNVKTVFRIHALVEPEIHIIAAADRIKTIMNQLTIIAGKVQARLAEAPAVSSSTAVQKAITDFTTKLNSASDKVQTAVQEVTVLKPDNGDKKVMTSNNTTLKDARAKIVAAQKDLIAARKDLQTVITTLGKEKPSKTNSSATSSNM